MSSLHNILNHENELDVTKGPFRDKSAVYRESISPPITFIQETEEKKGQKYRENLALSEHQPHPNCPDKLTCLPDTDSRPQHTLPVILRCAILGSPKKRLTIREIYAAMEEKYPYYRTAGTTWKQSVRHHLSLNRLFERQPRPITDPGFGSYWTVNLSAPPGTKRPRKRGRQNKDANSDGGALVIRKRGRPRKYGDDESILDSAVESPPAVEYPPLTLSTDDNISRQCRLSAVRTEYYPSDDEEEENVRYGERDDDDEYESEEEYPACTDYSCQQKTSAPTITAFENHRNLPLPTLVPVRDHYRHQEIVSRNSDQLIDRLRIEMEGLRRQSADAVSAAERVSDQLAQAQAEASRAKAKLRTAESMLEEEARKRRDAERAVEDEARRRLAAEEALIRARGQILERVR